MKQMNQNESSVDTKINHEDKSSEPTVPTVLTPPPSRNSEENLNKLFTQNINIQELSKDMENMKSALSNFYVPKHFDSLMKKVGNMEQNIMKAHESMTTCYYITFFIVVLFLIVALAAVYIIWRMNYFKLLLRHNKFGRYTRPKSCYACFKPWRKNYTTNAETCVKSSFSSPELMKDYKAPRPPITHDIHVSSDSEYG